MLSQEDEVRKSSERFYSALNRMVNGDPGPLTDCWSQAPDATTMHPIGRREIGWEAVRESFRQVAMVSSAGQVRLDDRLVRVGGDLAYELGTERGSMSVGGTPVAIEHRVTNIYRREGGAWKIVHHHTDVSPSMVEALNQLLARTSASR